MNTLSVVIPVYNEENTISQIIQKVKNVDLSIQKLKKEIIVVDDGSKDTTRAILSKIKDIKLFLHKNNKGKGAAIRTGLKHVTGDIVIVQDADLEYNPEEYSRLVTPILRGKTSVVYGSRFLSPVQRKTNFSFLKKVHNGQYFLGYIGSRVLTKMANILYGLKITDEATGYKVFKSSVFKEIELVGDGFEFCPEVTAKIAKKGYKIIEIPISYAPRRYEEGKKINWKHGLEAMWTLLKYKFKD